MAAITLTGSSTVRDTDVVIFGPLRFWADRGFIRVEDSRDNSYESFSVRTALLRMKAISDMLGNSSGRQMYSEDQFDRLNRERHAHMLEGLTVLTRRAQEQGMPTDPTAVRDLVRRRKKTFVVPGNMSAAATL